MGTKTLTPEEQLLKTTREKLSKYGTPQLLSKLRSGAFLRMSKDVALAILEKRGEDISEFKQSTTAEVPTTPSLKKVIEKVEKEKPAKVEKVKVEKSVKVEKVKVEKVAGEKKERKTRVSLNTDQVAEILKRSGEGESTFKIRKAMELSWSTVNNILLANKA